MRIRLKYTDIQTFIEKFAANVSRNGIFIASKSPKPVGTLLRFELTLIDGTTRLLRGEGTVTWVREFDSDNPARPHGMGVKFARLDADSRALLERIEDWKRDRAGGFRSAQDQEIDETAITTTRRRSDIQEIVAPPASAASSSVVSVNPLAAQPTPIVDFDDLDALLAADGPELEATLERARAIAHILAEQGFEELDHLRLDADEQQAAAAAARAALAVTLSEVRRPRALPSAPIPVEPAPILAAAAPLPPPPEPIAPPIPAVLAPVLQAEPPPKRKSGPTSRVEAPSPPSVALDSAAAYELDFAGLESTQSGAQLERTPSRPSVAPPALLRRPPVPSRFSPPPGPGETTADMSGDVTLDRSGTPATSSSLEGAEEAEETGEREPSVDIDLDEPPLLSTAEAVEPTDAALAEPKAERKGFFSKLFGK